MYFHSILDDTPQVVAEHQYAKSLLKITQLKEE
jgi:hypothetical protein